MTDRAARSRQLTEGLQVAVLTAGIDMFGVTTVAPLPTKPSVYRHQQAREVLPDAQAVVLAGFCVSYRPKLRASAPGVPRGRFTPYGSRAFMQMDSHCQNVVRSYLAAHGHQCVNAPRLPIKPAAVRAGLGRYGRHSVVATPKWGAWVMFSCFVTDAPLETVDHPLFAEAPCPPGCRRCIDACPTQAITEAYQIDRPRCVTEWLWGYPAPRELRACQDNRLFGCGECLLACPRNRKVAPRQAYPVPVDEMDDSPELVPLLTGDDEAVRRHLPAFALEAGVEAMRGNAIIALGNIGDPVAVAALGAYLRHPRPQLREYAAWSLGRIGGAEAHGLLEQALADEEGPAVRDEIRLALAEGASGQKAPTAS